MALTPSNLQSVSGVGDPISVLENNFGILNRDLYKVTPTYVNGVATTVIGPPTSGTHVTDEIWTDAWGGEWHCTAGGTPGTWRQHRFAIRSGEPGSGTIPNGYWIVDANDSFRPKIHVGSFVWRDDFLPADETRGLAAALAPRGGLRATGTASDRITGTTGLNIGTGDGALWIILALDDYTPSSNVTLFRTHTNGNNRISISLLTTGNFQVTFVDSGGSVTNYALTPDVALVNGEIYSVIITLDRDGVATLYVNGLSDRDNNGTGVTVSISGSSAVDVGSGNANTWGAMHTMNGTLYALAFYNRALSASDALDLAERGRVVYADQWGSVTANYTSDFSAGADSFTATGGSAAGNIDAIGGEDNTLRFTSDNANSSHNVVRTGVGVTEQKQYRVRARIYIPSTNTSLVRVRPGFSAAFTSVATLDAWVQVDVVAKADGSALRFYGADSSGFTTFTGTTGDVFYVKDITVTPAGALLDLDLHNADPAQHSWVRDRSSNVNTGFADTSGIDQVLRVPQLNPASLTVGGNNSTSTAITAILQASSSLNFGSISAASTADLTITVTGAEIGNAVFIGLPAAPDAGLTFDGFVSAADTVTIRATNITASPINPAGGNYRAVVFKF